MYKIIDCKYNYYIKHSSWKLWKLFSNNWNLSILTFTDKILDIEYKVAIQFHTQTVHKSNVISCILVCGSYYNKIGNKMWTLNDVKVVKFEWLK